MFGLVHLKKIKVVTRDPRLCLKLRRPGYSKLIRPGTYTYEVTKADMDVNVKKSVFTFINLNEAVSYLRRGN